MPAPTPEEKTRALLATLWAKNQSLVQDRLTTLDAAANAAATHTLTPDQQKEAAATAHKLAGSLGMYGFPTGTELARKLEQLYESPTPLDPLELRKLSAALRETLSL